MAEELTLTERAKALGKACREVGNLPILSRMAEFDRIGAETVEIIKNMAERVEALEGAANGEP